jgi:hypothetical protein
LANILAGCAVGPRRPGHIKHTITYLLRSAGFRHGNKFIRLSSLLDGCSPIEDLRLPLRIWQNAPSNKSILPHLPVHDLSLQRNKKQPT